MQVGLELGLGVGSGLGLGLGLGLTWSEHTVDCAARCAVEGRAAHRVGLGDGQLSGRREQGERGCVPAEEVVLTDVVLLARQLGGNSLGLSQ